MTETPVLMTDNLSSDTYNAEQLLAKVVLGIQEKKGTNIAILDMRDIENSVCSYFVICEGESSVHVAAIADSVQELVWKQMTEWPLHMEGKSQAQWVLVDYVDVVVHVFHKSVRPYYNLEGLWADAHRTDVENLF
jgi:ribosome-associated protein